MPAKLTLDAWIKRAKAIHGDRYGYSLVDYKSKDKQVTLICPVHGEFSQLAGNHLQGKGCKNCAPNARGSQKSFIEKAKAIHGDVYDYSDTVFIKNAAKVWIRCGAHGLFEQEANSHLMGSGCPDCADISRSVAVSNHPTREASIKKTVQERYGVVNVMHVDAYKEKLINTVRHRYGVDNYTQTPEYLDRYKETVLEKYGVIHYSKSNDFKSKNEATLLERYGVKNYTQSEEYNRRLPEILEKSQMTQLARYGVKHHAQTDEFKKKIETTSLARYGATNYGLSAEYQMRLPDILRNSNKTKRDNKTFTTSQPEERMFRILCDVFGENDVLRQYSVDARYPYMCDFYIKSRDLFIELNASWTHGKHWFDADRESDRERLAMWRDKGSGYYDAAVRTWSVQDVRKRTTAKENALNYAVFWDNDLRDFHLWLDDGAPGAKDYSKEYSWLNQQTVNI